MSGTLQGNFMIVIGGIGVATLLASPGSDDVTGQTNMVDGGMVLT